MISQQWFLVEEQEGPWGGETYCLDVPGGTLYRIIKYYNDHPMMSVVFVPTPADPVAVANNEILRQMQASRRPAPSFENILRKTIQNEKEQESNDE